MTRTAERFRFGRVKSPCWPRGNAPRGGKSLIELMVVISITGALFAVATWSLKFVLRLQSDLESSALMGRTVSRLSREFRRDAHATPKGNATVPQEPQEDPTKESNTKEASTTGQPLVRLQLSTDKTVTYAFEGGDVLRTEQSSGKSRQERYGLPRGSRCDIKGLGEGDSGLLELRLSIPARAVTTQGYRIDHRQLSPSAYRVHRIVAETGVLP